MIAATGLYMWIGLRENEEIFWADLLIRLTLCIQFVWEGSGEEYGLGQKRARPMNKYSCYLDPSKNSIETELKKIFCVS